MTEKGTEVWWWHFPQTGNVTRNSHMFRRVNWLLVTNDIEWPGKLILSCHMLGRSRYFLKLEFSFWFGIVLFPRHVTWFSHLNYFQKILLYIPICWYCDCLFSFLSSCSSKRCWFSKIQSKCMWYSSVLKATILSMIWFRRSRWCLSFTQWSHFKILSDVRKPVFSNSGSHFPQHETNHHPGSHHLV